MKLNKILLAGTTFSVMAFTACVDAPEYTPAEPIATPAEYYFSTTEADVELEVGDDDTKFTVMVYRAAAGEETTVAVNTEKNSDLFNVPASVTFAADATSAPLDVTFTPSELDRAADYNFTFTLSGQEPSQYYVTQSQYLVNYVTWIPMVGANGETTGIWVDDIMTGGFNVDILDITETILINPQLPGIYCVVNPYNESWPYLGSFKVVNDDVKIYFNCTDPEKVFMCDKKGKPVDFYSFGISFDGDEFGLACLASYFLAEEKEDRFNATCGMLKGGNITFPQTNSLMLTTAKDWEEGSGWWANADGKFAIILPGYENLNVDVWETVGEGTWTDGFITSWYRDYVSESTYPVEIQQLVQEDDATVIYRMVNPYLEGVCPYGQPSDKDVYIEIDASNPDCVKIEDQDTGLVSDEYGEISILNAGWLLSVNSKTPKTDDEIIAAGMNDVLADGVLTIKGSNEFFYMPLRNEKEYIQANRLFQRDSKLVFPSEANASAVSYATKAAGKLRQPAYSGNKGLSVRKNSPMAKISK